VKLRASYGTAFRSPSFLDLYGQSAFYQGNPNLRPEEAKGWDTGLDWYLGRGTLGVTWFDTEFTDLIASTANFRSVENIQRARTRGVEFTARIPLGPATDVRAAYSYLEADNLTSGSRLLRRPRHHGNADLWHDFGRGVSAGAGVGVTAQREDVDAQTYRTIDAEDYTVVRVYGEYKVTQSVTLRCRLENLLGEKYEDVNGYPALGFGAFAGLEWKF